MHGWLWALHKDHHQPSGEGFWERNDYFFLIFAIPAALSSFVGVCSYINWMEGLEAGLWIGIGVTVYGICYFMVHDVFIHRRFKFLDKLDQPYFRALRKAHKIHHKHLGKEDGECFGMLWVPLKYYREAKRAKTR